MYHINLLETFPLTSNDVLSEFRLQQWKVKVPPYGIFIVYKSKMYRIVTSLSNTLGGGGGGVVICKYFVRAE